MVLPKKKFGDTLKRAKRLLPGRLECGFVGCAYVLTLSNMTFLALSPGNTFLGLSWKEMGKRPKSRGYDICVGFLSTQRTAHAGWSHRCYDRKVVWSSGYCKTGNSNYMFILFPSLCHTPLFLISSQHGDFGLPACFLCMMLWAHVWKSTSLTSRTVISMATTRPLMRYGIVFSKECDM